MLREMDKMGTPEQVRDQALCMFARLQGLNKNTAMTVQFLKTEVVKVYKRINIVEVKFKGWVWEVPFCLVDPPTIVVSGKRTTNSVYKR